METEDKNRALDNPIMRAAIAHFEPNEIRFVEIEAWKDDDGKPFVIYYYPWTLADKAWFQKRGGDEGAGLLAYADLVVRKACDQHGSKMFGGDARPLLLNKVDPNVLVALVTHITAAPAPSEYLKN